MGLLQSILKLNIWAYIEQHKCIYSQLKTVDNRARIVFMDIYAAVQISTTRPFHLIFPQIMPALCSFGIHW